MPRAGSAEFSRISQVPIPKYPLGYLQHQDVQMQVDDENTWTKRLVASLATHLPKHTVKYALQSSTYQSTFSLLGTSQSVLQCYPLQGCSDGTVNNIQVQVEVSEDDPPNSPSIHMQMKTEYRTMLENKWLSLHKPTTLTGLGENVSPPSSLLQHMPNQGLTLQ